MSSDQLTRRGLLQGSAVLAAAALIVQEAGGTVTDALGDPLLFNRPQPTAFGLLCAAPGIHAAAVERLTPRAREILGQPQG